MSLITINKHEDDFYTVRIDKYDDGQQFVEAVGTMKFIEELTKKVLKEVYKSDGSFINR